MTIFSSIMQKIFHSAGSSEALAPARVEAPAETAAQSAQAPAPTPAQASASTPTENTPNIAGTQPVDVEQVLTQMAKQKGNAGNWRGSIVDLLKLLDLDSGLNARKELANELNIHVGVDGTAEENIALHQAVMQKLAENGGKIPDSLKS